MIQVNTVSGGKDAFNALLYPDTGYLDMNSFDNRLNDVRSRVVGASELFMEKTREVYDNVNNSTALSIARQALNSAKGIMRPDVIFNAGEENIRNSTGIMARYIMAEPTIRELYHGNKCHGYQDTYTDLYPNDTKEKHIDYGRVMNGVMIHDNENNNDSWEINYYSDTLDEDEPLKVRDQLDILSTWDTVSYMIAKGTDPSDPEEDSLL